MFNNTPVKNHGYEKAKNIPEKIEWVEKSQPWSACSGQDQDIIYLALAFGAWLALWH